MIAPAGMRKEVRGTGTMEAFVKDQPGEGLGRARKPVPQPGPGQVQIRVLRAGICGTDRHIAEWAPWAHEAVPLGTTLGHEFVGVVSAVGDGVRSVAVGDRVSGEGHIFCGTCALCRTGRAHICASMRALGIDWDGAFAPYLVLPERNVWKVHPEIPDRWAAALDPFGNAVHVVQEGHVAGKRVLVLGAGTIGLMAIPVARALGVRSVAVVEPDPVRRALALGLGADAAVGPSEPDWSAGGRPQVLFEMSGRGEVLSRGLDALENGGRAVVLGIPSRPVELDLAKRIVLKGATLVGVYGRRIFSTWELAEELLLDGKVDLDRVITHEFPLEEVERGIALMQKGEAIKVLLEVAG